jgi:hypothetical protein
MAGCPLAALFIACMTTKSCCIRCVYGIFDMNERLELVVDPLRLLPSTLALSSQHNQQVFFLVLIRFQLVRPLGFYEVTRHIFRDRRSVPEALVVVDPPDPQDSLCGQSLWQCTRRSVKLHY